MDISGFFNQFFGYILTWFQWVYNTLDSITFNGISLLDYSISILLISAVLPLVITLIRTHRVGGHNEGFNEAEYEKRYTQQETVRRRVQREMNNREQKEINDVLNNW